MRHRPRSNWILAAGVLIALGAIFFIRNGLIGKDEEVGRRWANVEATLQRRLDLVPQLVESVEAATQYESSTLEKITEMRNEILALSREMKSALQHDDPGAVADLDATLVASVRAFTGLSREAYPELGATEAYLSLMTQLEGTENRINVARQDFNEAVAESNTAVRRWGWLPFCGDFERWRPFVASPEAARAPALDLDATGRADLADSGEER